MLRLSKRVEYGILAVKYIAENPDKKVTAKEIAEKMNISYEFLAKTMQKLMKSGLIVSQIGLNGGYTLEKDPDSITIADIINALDEDTTIVECFGKQGNNACERDEICEIRHDMSGLQKEINNVFKNMTISKLGAN
ncbi:Rrf2 family transcriptional regulator [Bacteroidetes/Chlorobi group bacterium ChocPot_Mid]|jgi:Rrf2 family protein|nr:MAG: Rrf2 family transcriptional regulator [Bacteroidetes/Chlorobi group bacterium ChocPot_Mid]